MRQRELAIKLGISHDLRVINVISHQQIQKYESGKDQVSAARLLDIANILGEPPQNFYQDVATSTDKAVYLQPKITLRLSQYFDNLEYQECRKAVLYLLKSMSGVKD